MRDRITVSENSSRLIARLCIGMLAIFLQMPANAQTPRAASNVRPAPQKGADFLRAGVGLSAGFGYGQYDYTCPATSSNNGNSFATIGAYPCTAQGILGTLGVNASLAAGPVLLRARFLEDLINGAHSRQAAILAGLGIGERQQFYFAAGPGRIWSLKEGAASRVPGTAFEILYREQGNPVQVSLQGQLSKVNFAVLAVSLELGNF